MPQRLRSAPGIAPSRDSGGALPISDYAELTLSWVPALRCIVKNAAQRPGDDASLPCGR
jgi:hypothetical protein